MHNGMFAVHIVKGVNNERNQKTKIRHTRVSAEVFQWEFKCRNLSNEAWTEPSMRNVPLSIISKFPTGYWNSTLWKHQKCIEKKIQLLTFYMLTSASLLF